MQNNNGNNSQLNNMKYISMLCTIVLTNKWNTTAAYIALPTNEYSQKKKISMENDDTTHPIIQNQMMIFIYWRKKWIKLNRVMNLQVNKWKQ